MKMRDFSSPCIFCGAYGPCSFNCKPDHDRLMSGFRDHEQSGAVAVPPEFRYPATDEDVLDEGDVGLIGLMGEELERF